MVAIVRPYQPSVVTEPQPFVAVRAPDNRTGEMLGAALSDMGDAMWVMEDELATAHAYQVDAEWTDFLRQVQYGNGDGTGYLNAKGFDAVNGRDGIVEQVQAKYRELVESLNPRVRPGAVRSMETRYQTFIKSVNTHSVSQASAARAAASSAREKVSALAAYDALAAGDIEGFQQQAAAIRASLMDDPAFARADEDGQRIMIWKKLEPLYKQYVDEVVRTQGAAAGLTAAEQAYADGNIGPSTVMDTRQRLEEAAEIEGALSSVDAAIASGNVVTPGAFDTGAGTSTGSGNWWDTLPTGE